MLGLPVHALLALEDSKRAVQRTQRQMHQLLASLAFSAASCTIKTILDEGESERKFRCAPVTSSTRHESLDPRKSYTRYTYAMTAAQYLTEYLLFVLTPTDSKNNVSHRQDMQLRTLFTWTIVASSLVIGQAG